MACHMPSTTYMVVDPRRDHSLRIPRPDLSAALGVPNPCTDCHSAEPVQWAVAALRSWSLEETLRVTTANAKRLLQIA